ncbi:MAG: YtcA family lipoprotein [Saezia sp.]
MHYFKYITFTLGLFLCGCASAPTIELFGAYFPDWIFCIAGGVLGTILVHIFLGIFAKRELLSPLALSYSALTALFSILIWFISFPR